MLAFGDTLLRLLLFYQTPILSFFTYLFYVLMDLQVTLQFTTREKLIESFWFRGQTPSNTSTD